MRNEAERNFVEAELKKLSGFVDDLNWTTVTTRNVNSPPSQSIQLRGDGGNALARLLHEAGAKYGTRSSNMTDLPLHIRAASEVAIRSPHHVEPILEDFIHVLVLTKGRKRHNNRVKVRLPCVAK